jgi:transcriptional regulator GlxA family with amidase domain
MVTGVWDILSQANQFYYQQYQKNLFNLELVAKTKSPIRSSSGLAFTPHQSIATKKTFDVLYIPGFMGDTDSIIADNKELVRWIAQINTSKTLLTAACNGNFLLAQSNQLANKKATTHWNLAQKFQQDYKDIKVMPEKIIVDNGNVISAAGVTSYFNLALHLIQRFSTPEISTACAKIFLVDAGRKIQTPYQMVEFPKSHGDDLILKTQEWMENNYKDEISMDKLAAENNTSTKTLTRRFKKATGDTPQAYLQKLRIETAKRLLESKDISFSQITWEVGYNDASSFHRAFKLQTGLTPIDYRNKFSFV